MIWIPCPMRSGSIAWIVSTTAEAGVFSPEWTVTLSPASLAFMTGSTNSWMGCEKGGRLIVVDPRRTAIAQNADLYVRLNLGTSGSARSMPRM